MRHLLLFLVELSSIQHDTFLVTDYFLKNICLLANVCHFNI